MSQYINNVIKLCYYLSGSFCFQDLTANLLPLFVNCCIINVNKWITSELLAQSFPVVIFEQDLVGQLESGWPSQRVYAERGQFTVRETAQTSVFLFGAVRLSPERMGPLGKSLAICLALLQLQEPQLYAQSPQYTPTLVYPIRVWSYATYIVIKAVINRYLAVKT